MAIHRIDLLNVGYEFLRSRDVQLRFVSDTRLTQALCRLGKRQILFIDESSSVTDQLDLLGSILPKLVSSTDELPHVLQQLCSTPQIFVATAALH